MNTKTLAPTKYAERLAKIERDILELKKSAPSRSHGFVSLRGALKGMKISEKEIARAKKSLFKS